MSSREKYHVTQRDDGKWQVKHEGGERASGLHDTKDKAVDQARGLAQNGPLGQVIIHGRDGKIQEERTYGNDPFPPRG